MTGITLVLTGKANVGEWSLRTASTAHTPCCVLASLTIDGALATVSTTPLAGIQVAETIVTETLGADDVAALA